LTVRLVWRYIISAPFTTNRPSKAI